jgi:hypothetical protein
MADTLVEHAKVINIQWEMKAWLLAGVEPSFVGTEDYIWGVVALLRKRLQAWGLALVVV